MQIGSALLVPLQQHGHALGASGTAEDEHRTEYLQRLHRLVQQRGREHDGRERLKIPAYGDGLHRQFLRYLDRRDAPAVPAGSTGFDNRP